MKCLQMEMFMTKMTLMVATSLSDMWSKENWLKNGIKW